MEVSYDRFAELAPTSFEFPDSWTEEDRFWFYEGRYEVLRGLYGANDGSAPISVLCNYDVTTLHRPMAVLTLLQEGLVEVDMARHGVRLTDAGKELALGVAALRQEVTV